ncbi:MAG: hypothetical protein AAFR61_30885 [Bacteroidota bacterium]
MERLYAICSFWAFVAFGIFPGMAQPTLFDHDEVLEIRLEGDFSAFQANLLKEWGDPPYYPAKFTYQTSAGESYTVNLKFQARGRNRRDPNTCNFPPIRINFPGDGEVPTPFNGQNKLKVVTHCQEEEAIIREYLVYKMYNLISPEESYRVRMARITYVDTGKGNVESTHLGFFIESAKEMTRRLASNSISKSIDVNKEDVDRANLTKVALFQYMVANNDYDVLTRQNLRIITNPEFGGMPLAVPYDFDGAWLVDASYSLAKTMGKKANYLSERKMKRICRELSEWQEAFKTFKGVEEQVYALYEHPGLSKTYRKQALKNLKNFYKTAANEKKVQTEMVGRCQQ